MSEYQLIAQNFLDAHPIGSVVTAAALEDWANEHADGTVLKSDLAITSRAGRLRKLRRHLNESGKSLPPPQRFALQTGTVARGVSVVRAYVDFITEQANVAVARAQNALRKVESQRTDAIPS